MDAKQTGTFKRVIADRGFAFITNDANGTDLFVHVTDVADDLLPFAEHLVGERVAFDSVEGRENKPRAINVERIH
jgi:CspA family cold shock protein